MAEITETIFVYRIPQTLEPSMFENLIGREGTRIMPTKDGEDRYFLTQETVNSPEFDVIRRAYKTIVEQFELVPLIPKNNDIQIDI